MLFHGSIGGTATYIDCLWSGSDAGLSSVSGITVLNTGGIPLFGSPAHFLKPDGSVTGFSTAVPTAGELTGIIQSDMCFADTSVASAIPSIANYAYQDLTGGAGVGVCTFTWYKNLQTGATAGTAAQTAWSHLSNISTYQAQVILGSGSVSADFLTGVAADSTTPVYLVGRNVGSGTRANALNDTTYGFANPVTQYSIGGGIALNPIDNSPIAVNGTTSPLNNEGDNGYESGLNQSQAMAALTPPSANSGWFAIAYSGVADATGNGNTAAQMLTENGVLESNGSVETGAYSYWGYENAYGRSNLAGYQLTDSTLLVNATINQMANVLNYGVTPAAHDRGIPMTRMNASKVTDQSYPTHN
jgi:hypothetical protein